MDGKVSPKVPLLWAGTWHRLSTSKLAGRLNVVARCLFFAARVGNACKYKYRHVGAVLSCPACASVLVPRAASRHAVLMAVASERPAIHQSVKLFRCSSPRARTANASRLPIVLNSRPFTGSLSEAAFNRRRCRTWIAVTRFPTVHSKQQKTTFLAQ